MSTMGDQKKSNIPFHNLKGLTQDLSERLDERMSELRSGTPLGTVRPFDAKVFMLASRAPRSSAKIARALNVSKQAVQSSVNRLLEKGVVKNEALPGNRKEKVVSVTPEGEKAKLLVAKHIATIEMEIAEKIGQDRAEQLRSILFDLLKEGS